MERFIACYDEDGFLEIVYGSFLSKEECDNALDLVDEEHSVVLSKKGFELLKKNESLLSFC